MTHSTIVRSPGAIALGAVCALGTLLVLFWHVRAPSDFTLNHVYILLALVVTYGAGHFMWDAFGDGTGGGVIRGLAFLVLFTVGTAICVALSGGRSAEMLERKEADANHENGKRLAHEARIASAKRDLEEADAAFHKAEADVTDKAEAMAIECGTGKRSKCDGKTLTHQTAVAAAAEKKKLRDQADSHYWMLVARLGQFKAPLVANAELKTLAKVLAHVRGIDESQAMASVLLLLPYGLALLTEFGSIVFFKHGFGRRKVSTVNVDTNTTLETGVLETVPPEPPGGGPKETRKPKNRRATEQSSNVVQLPVRIPPKAKDETLAFVRAEIAARGEIPSQDDLAARAGVTKGAVSKWLKAWEAAGLISRTRVGRRKVIGSA